VGVRVCWSNQVAACARGTAGGLTLTWEALAITAEPGLALTLYTAEPGSPSAGNLNLLATWAATQEADSATQ
jgi:hypothetical protein